MVAAWATAVAVVAVLSPDPPPAARAAMPAAPAVKAPAVLKKARRSLRRSTRRFIASISSRSFSLVSLIWRPLHLAAPGPARADPGAKEWRR